MDITQQFKASVMTVKLQRRSELPQQNKNTLDKNRILPKGGKSCPAPRDEFERKAKDACNEITNLRNVLLENRTAYMRIGQHLKRATTMTDDQRDLIDRESERFVKHYTQHLANMRADFKRVKCKQQEREHMEAVLDLLVSYLHSVQQIYLDQKKYRIQHELETYRLLKLAADKKLIPVRPAGEQSGKLRRRRLSSEEEEKESTDETDDKSDPGWNDSWQWGDDDDDNNENGVNNIEQQNISLDSKQRSSRVHKKQTTKAAKTLLTNGEAELKAKSSQVALDEDIQKSAEQQDDEDETNALSPEDIQVFEQENMQLYHELQGLTEEVEQIEKNVVDIAQLQDIFTEKVTLQQHNIDRIVSAVVGATENVKDANEQIRQATQRNAGIRVWSLFFLLVMSFSLLFLDWYYD